MLKMQISSNATNQMQSIIAKIDSFPNRISSIQQSALHRSRDNLVLKLINTYPAALYLDYLIEKSGDLGYKMTITPDKTMKTSHGDNAYIAAVVFLKGRKAYDVRPKGKYKMVLRPESVPPYPKALEYARIPRMQGKSEEIKMEARNIIISNLEYAIKRFGFGPRGGSSGLADLPYVRSRAGGR